MVFNPILVGDKRGVQYIGLTTDTTDATTYTFTNVDIGQPHQQRVILLGVGAHAAGSTSVSTISVNGITATNMTQVGSVVNPVRLGRAAVPNDRFATIVLTMSGACLSAFVYVWRIMPNFITPVGATAGNSATTTTASTVTDLPVSAGGFVVGLVSDGVSGAVLTWTWNGQDPTPVNRDTTSIEAAITTSGCDFPTNADSTTSDLTVTPDLSGTKRAIGTSWW